MSKIGLRQVIILVLTACLGIRWIPVAGAIGPAAFSYWLLGAGLFLLPLALIVIELSLNFAENGGIHLWVTKAYGPKAGYYVAWLYWVNNFFFYPALVVFMVANFAYLIGAQELANNQLFVLISVIVVLWLAIFINARGVKTVSNITGLSCFLNICLGLFIIAAGAYFLWGRHVSATPLSWSVLFPKPNQHQQLANLTLLMFALSGVELIPTLAGLISNSRRNLARGVVIALSITMAIYLLGSLAINIVLSPSQLNNATGLMDALLVIAAKLEHPALAKLLILALLLVEIGALIVWLVGPTVMFFECVEPGIIPEWLTRLNHRQIPANALYLIGVAVTLIVGLSQYLPTVNALFTTLALMGTIVYFLPFLWLAFAYLKLKRQRLLSYNLLPWSLSLVCAFSLGLAILLGIACSFVPSSDLVGVRAIAYYELELVGGPLLFLVIGYLIYRFRDKRVKYE